MDSRENRTGKTPSGKDQQGAQSSEGRIILMPFKERHRQVVKFMGEIQADNWMKGIQHVWGAGQIQDPILWDIGSDITISEQAITFDYKFPQISYPVETGKFIYYGMFDRQLRFSIRSTRDDRGTKLEVTRSDKIVNGVKPNFVNDDKFDEQKQSVFILPEYSLRTGYRDRPRSGDMPTMSSALQRYDYNTTDGYLSPNRTPEEIIDAIAHAFESPYKDMEAVRRSTAIRLAEIASYPETGPKLEWEHHDAQYKQRAFALYILPKDFEELARDRIRQLQSIEGVKWVAPNPLHPPLREEPERSLLDRARDVFKWRT